MKKKYMFVLVFFFLAIGYIVFYLNSQTDIAYYKQSATYITDIFMKATLLTDSEDELIANKNAIDELVLELNKVNANFRNHEGVQFTDNFISLAYEVVNLNIERVQNIDFNKQEKLFEKTDNLFKQYEHFNNFFDN